MTPIQISLLDGTIAVVQGTAVSKHWAATPHGQHWTVTHIPSGRGLASMFKGDHAAAVRKAQEIDMRFPDFELHDLDKLRAFFYE